MGGTLEPNYQPFTTLGLILIVSGLAAGIAPLPGPLSPEYRPGAVDVDLGLQEGRLHLRDVPSPNSALPAVSDRTIVREEMTGLLYEALHALKHQ